MSKRYSWLVSVAGSILLMLPYVLVNLMNIDYSHRLMVASGYIFGSPFVVIILIDALFFSAHKPLGRNKKLFRLSLLFFLLWCYLLLIMYINSSEGLGIILAGIFMMSAPIVLIFFLIGLFLYTRD